MKDVPKSTTNRQYEIFLGHGGLSAISTKAPSSPSSPSSTSDSRSVSQNNPSCVATGGANKSMLVMSGGEGYIDFRLGRLINNHIHRYGLGSNS